MKSGINISLLIFVIVSCVEPVDFESIGFDDLLVVDAMITDEPGIQTVILSRTHPLGSDTTVYEWGASVYMQDLSGRRVDFLQNNSGFYQTASDFAVIPGEKWQLFITTSDERNYISEIAEVIPTPAIDSLYAEFIPSSSSINNLGGNFTFYIDAHQTNNTEYMRWTWNRTFELSVANPSRWLWTGGNNYEIRELGGVNDSIQVEICWRTEILDKIMTRKLIDPGEGVVRLPMTSFHSDSKLMLRGYSMEVKQYALSEASFNYWNEIGNSIQGQGGISAIQVGTIRGNIRSVDNPDEIVLGYFDAVDEESVRRMFVAQNFNAAGYRRRFLNYVSCYDIETRQSDISELGETMEAFGPGWAIAFFTSPSTVHYLPSRCSECTYYGSNKKPDFWE